MTAREGQPDRSPFATACPCRNFLRYSARKQKLLVVPLDREHARVPSIVRRARPEEDARKQLAFGNNAMDKKVAGLLGAAAALTAMQGVQATAAPATEPAASANYHDLLEPIPNALDALKADDAQLAAGARPVQMAQLYHHHHHHHHHTIIITATSASCRLPISVIATTTTTIIITIIIAVSAFMFVEDRPRSKLASAGYGLRGSNALRRIVPPG